MVKVELRAYNQTYDISNSIANIDDIEVTLERVGMDAVYKVTTFDFEFVDYAFQILNEIFYGPDGISGHRQFSKASVLVYRRNRDFSYSTTCDQYDLDFLTFSKTDDIIKISARDNTLSSIVKAKKSVVYDIPVDDLKEDIKWAHYGIRLFNTALAGIESLGGVNLMVENSPLFPQAFTYSPHFLFWDSNIITVGGAARDSSIIIKNFLIQGDDRPSFYNPNVGDTKNYPLWTVQHNIKGNLILKIRGIIMAALAHHPDWNHASQLRNHGLNNQMLLTLSVYTGGGTSKKTLIDYFWLVDDFHFSMPGVYATGDPIPYNSLDMMVIDDEQENLPGSILVTGIFGVKITNPDTPMLDCFPIDEEIPPVNDNDFLELRADNVELSAGEEIRLNIGWSIITPSVTLTSSGNSLPSAGDDSYYTPTVFPYVIGSSYKPGLITSPRGEAIDLARVVNPTDDPYNQKFFFGMTDWRTYRRSWLDGQVSFEYIAAMPLSYFDIINPFNLFQKLVDNMTQLPSGYNISIEDMNINDTDLDMLIAGESLIPKFYNPKIHTSFADFQSWIEALGYSILIDNDSVNFVKRKTAFDKELLTQDISDIECEDLTESIEADMIYSSIKIGYGKQTYDGNNARLEFNGEHDYSIDNSFNNKELSIISNYRSDSVGLELKWINLLDQQTRDTSSTESDKDVFVVNLRRLSDNYLQIDTEYEIGDDMGQYNWKYNPRKLMERNLDLIAPSGQVVRFTSSSANSNFGVTEYDIAELITRLITLSDDFPLDKVDMVMEPIIYDFSVGMFKGLPDKSLWGGIVKFAYNGEIKEGFIREISKFINQEQEVQYKLYKKYDGWKDKLIPVIITRDNFNISGLRQIKSIPIFIQYSFNLKWKIINLPNGVALRETTDYTSKLDIQFDYNLSGEDKEYSFTIATEDGNVQKTFTVTQKELIASIFPENNIESVSTGFQSNTVQIRIQFRGIPPMLIEQFEQPSNNFVSVNNISLGFDNELNESVAYVSLQPTENVSATDRQETVNLRVVDLPSITTSFEFIQKGTLITLLGIVGGTGQGYIWHIGRSSATIKLMIGFLGGIYDLEARYDSSLSNIILGTSVDNIEHSVSFMISENLNVQTRAFVIGAGVVGEDGGVYPLIIQNWLT